MDTQKNRPRWKLKAVDIIIIAVMIIAAAALLYIWQSSGKSSGVSINTTSVHYSIELSGMVGGVAATIHEGDTIVDSTKKYVMGTVESVTIVPYTTNYTDLETGDTVTSVVPEKETAIIQLVCDCSVRDAEITAVSGYVIRIGAEVQATGPGYAGLGYIIAIDREGLQ